MTPRISKVESRSRNQIQTVESDSDLPATGTPCRGSLACDPRLRRAQPPERGTSITGAGGGFSCSAFTAMMSTYRLFPSEILIRCVHSTTGGAGLGRALRRAVSRRTHSSVFLQSTSRFSLADRAEHKGIWHSAEGVTAFGIDFVKCPFDYCREGPATLGFPGPRGKAGGE